MHPDPDDQKALIARLSRVEGQVRGVRQMIGDGAACRDVAQQLSAARKALDKAFYEAIACALRHHLAAHPAEAGVQIDEFTALLSKYG